MAVPKHSRTVQTSVHVSLLALSVLALLTGCEPQRRTQFGQAPVTLSQMQAQELSPGGAPVLPESPSAEVVEQSGLTEPEIYRGRGVPAVQVAENAASAGTVGNGDVTVNFVNAEVRDVVDEVLGNILGLSYVIDPRVQGTVTFRSVRPLPRSAAIGALEDVLAMNGAALIKEGELYKIVPLEESVSAPAILRQGSLPVDLDRGFSLHVFPLRYASAAALEEAIQPLVPSGRQLRVDRERNLFILAATGPEADDFADLLALFDVDWMADKSFGLFPLKHANAANVAEELGRIYGQDDTEGVQAGIIEFVPIERLNAVLVITPQEAYVDDALAWVQRLDRGIEADRRQLYVYFVQNGRAKELADVVGKALSAEVVQGEEESTEARLAPGLDSTELTGEVPLLDGRTDIPIENDTETLSDIYGTDEPLSGVHPRTRDAFGGPDFELEGGEEDQQEPGQTAFRIVADTRNNALLIHATAAEYQVVEAALKKLDIVPLQVFIEATIAEVTLNDTLKYGLEWFFDIGDSTITFNTSTTPLAKPTPSSVIFTQPPGFSYLLASGDARVVLNALSQITDVKVISSPQLMVLDNEPARLQVGDQVPISVRSSTAVTAEAPIVNEIEYRDTGVILDIIPRVNASGLVVLDIIQEVSDVVASSPTTSTTTQTITPTIAQRRIASTIAVNSGESVALGGLIRDSGSEAITGVPLLSDIPVLGHLFKTTTDTQRRTELLVLLTPRVVRDRQDARVVTDELRRRLRAVTDLPQLIQ